MESQCTIWEPPTFDTSVQPSLAHEANLLSDPNFQENFARSAKWYVQLKYRLFEAIFSLMPRNSRIHGLPDHWHGNEGAQMVLSLSHTARIAVCNISTCGFLFPLCVLGSQNLIGITRGASPQDIGNEVQPRSGQPNNSSVLVWVCSRILFISVPSTRPIRPSQDKSIPASGPHS